MRRNARPTKLPARARVAERQTQWTQNPPGSNPRASSNLASGMGLLGDQVATLDRIPPIRHTLPHSSHAPPDQRLLLVAQSGPFAGAAIAGLCPHGGLRPSHSDPASGARPALRNHSAQRHYARRVRPGRALTCGPWSAAIVTSRLEMIPRVYIDPHTRGADPRAEEFVCSIGTGGRTVGDSSVRGQPCLTRLVVLGHVADIKVGVAGQIASGTDISMAVPSEG